jgi:hypothetical protein
VTPFDEGRCQALIVVQSHHGRMVSLPKLGPRLHVPLRFFLTRRQHRPTKWPMIGGDPQQ